LKSSSEDLGHRAECLGLQVTEDCGTSVFNGIETRS
jgi:hypothetical protein